MKRWEKITLPFVVALPFLGFLAFGATKERKARASFDHLIGLDEAAVNKAVGQPQRRFKSNDSPWLGGTRPPSRSFKECWAYSVQGFGTTNHPYVYFDEKGHVDQVWFGGD